MAVYANMPTRTVSQTYCQANRGLPLVCTSTFGYHHFLKVTYCRPYVCPQDVSVYVREWVGYIQPVDLRSPQMVGLVIVCPNIFFYDGTHYLTYTVGL